MLGLRPLLGDLLLAIPSGLMMGFGAVLVALAIYGQRVPSPSWSRVRGPG
jgi:ABC-type uncharacterized transport system YnjBCD permease subunit